ncbi:hypothetical protein ABKW28_12980 [Nocardioides sp. 31GB23]|uniref:hypothetical protein n=1 Tax=Nocardioides sp. 31GB23 TaxID=3156065 RepID=UPI0032AEFF7D
MRKDSPNSSRYLDRVTNTYRTPCERCGVVQSAQFCRDCRAVDPDFTAGGRAARAHQKFMAARQRVIDQIDFHAWIYAQYDGGSRHRTAQQRLRLAAARDTSPAGAAPCAPTAQYREDIAS